MSSSEVLFDCIQIGDIKVLSSVLNRTNIDSINEYGESLLHEAISCEELEIANLLLDMGADVSAINNDGQTILHYAVVKKFADLVSRIIDRGLDIVVSDKHGNQALWTAAFNARGEYRCVELLKIAGADENHKNKNSKSPLDFAEQIGDLELIGILKSSIKE